MKKKLESETICANCGKPFPDNDYAKLSRLIMRQKPYCSFECNQALKQTRCVPEKEEF